MMWPMSIMALGLALSTVGATETKNSRMYNGQIAGIGKYPWTGSLLPVMSDTHLCSVNTLSARWLMTSSHCVPLEGHNYRVSLGHGAPVIYHIDQIVKHKKFEQGEFEGNGTKFEHDIALLHTTRDIQFNAHIQAARLPDHPVPTGMSCWAIGQGVRYDESATYVAVGTTDVSDAPHLDHVPADMTNQYIILDPRMIIPVNGTLTHWDVYIRIPILDTNDYISLQVFRPLGPPGQFSRPYSMAYKPTAVGPHRVSVAGTWSVMLGDTIGLYYRYEKGFVARIPFRERTNCQMASLNFSTPYGSNNYYTPLVHYPCREYPIRVNVKINASLSGLEPRLEEIKVNVRTSEPEKIIVAGKDAVPCEGDDGGSLSCDCGGVTTVYGIFSYAMGSCSADNPNAVFTQVFNYTDWIMGIIYPKEGGDI